MKVHLKVLNMVEHEQGLKSECDNAHAILITVLEDLFKRKKLKVVSDIVDKGNLFLTLEIPKEEIVKRYNKIMGY